MKPHNKLHGRFFLGLGILLVTLVFDIFLPVRYDFDNVYIVSLFFIINEPRRVIILLGILTVSSILLVSVVEARAYRHWVQLFGRLISIMVAVVADITILRYNSQQAAHKKARDKRMQVIRKVLFINSHKIRMPVTNIIGLSYLLNHPTNSPEDLAKIVNGMKESAVALDGATRELSISVADLKESAE